MQSQQDGEASRSSFGSGTTSMERAAQGGRGFQTVGLDLGVLGAKNNDRSSEASGGARSGQNSATYQSSSTVDHQSHNSKHSDGGRSYSDEDYENEEYDEAENAKEQGGQSSSWSRSSGYSYSHKQPLSVQHANVDQQFKHYPKSKRDTANVIQLPICKSTECEYVRCVVGPLEKNSEALIALRTRLVAHTLNKVRQISFIDWKNKEYLIFKSFGLFKS